MNAHPFKSSKHVMPHPTSANRKWLTCDLVEQLQQLAHAGRSCSAFVDSIEAATLPALIEYGCARWHHPALPQLPRIIAASPIGRALAEVRSELGLRVSGAAKVPPSSISPRQHEFIVLSGTDATLQESWTEFLIRFRQSAKRVGFTIEKAKGLAASLAEMADNAVLHANAPVGVLIGYQAVDGAAVCCVGDVGDGVLKSLTSHPAYHRLRTHKEAIRVALQAGETRFGPGQGGLGFYRVFKALAASWGTLRFRSGEGCISMDGREVSADRGEEAFVLSRPGFQVTICCRASDRDDAYPLV